VIERAREPKQGLPPSSRELRRRRARRLAIRFLLGVGVPTLAAIVYYGFVAAPQYDSTAVLALEQSADPLGPPAKTGSKDVKVVREHIRSRAMVDVLAREHGLAEHYKSGGWLSGLDQDAGADRTFEYFLEKLKITHDPKSNTIKVRVRAFSPERALAFNRAIVAAADAKVREISDIATGNILRMAEDRVAKARNKGEQSRELDYALDGLERAREEAARTSAYLVVISEPSLPDAPAHPKRLWSIATVFVTALALVAIFSLLGSAVREHAQF
jgi:capsular polysaccharide transport system permease protein